MIVDMKSYAARRIRNLEREKFLYAAKVLRQEAELMGTAPQGNKNTRSILAGAAYVLRERATAETNKAEQVPE